MGLRENKALVRRIIERGWNAGDLAVFDTAYAPDVILYTTPEPEGVAGIDHIKEVCTSYRRAFPDVRFLVEDQIAEDDKVVTRITWHGTHREEWDGMRPTGKRVTGRSILIHQIDGGKVVARWSLADRQGVREQIQPGSLRS